MDCIVDAKLYLWNFMLLASKIDNHQAYYTQTTKSFTSPEPKKLLKINETAFI